MIYTRLGTPCEIIKADYDTGRCIVKRQNTKNDVLYTFLCTLSATDGPREIIAEADKANKKRSRK